MALNKSQMEILSKLSREDLLEFIDMQQKNWWNLQNKANGDYAIWKVGDTKFRIRVTNCHQQVRRVEEGMGELACKPAGIAISEAAARAINPTCEVRCIVCPPDEHPRDVWCEWEFELPGAK